MYEKGNKKLTQLQVIGNCTCEIESKLFSMLKGGFSASDAFLVASAKFNLQTKSNSIWPQYSHLVHLWNCKVYNILIAIVKSSWGLNTWDGHIKASTKVHLSSIPLILKLHRLLYQKRKTDVREAINSFKHKYLKQPTKFAN